MATVKITRKDKGLRKIISNLVEKANSVVIGIGEADGSKQYEDGNTVAEVAIWNHFGTSTIPARPFISEPIEVGKNEIRALQVRLAKGVYEGKLTKFKALGFIGLDIKTRVQKAIVAGVPPPNAPSTITAKKSSGTLRDTGQLLQSIDFEIREE